MKIHLVCGVWLLCAASAFCGENYQARFEKLTQNGNVDRKKAEALLAEWREKQPDDPEAWIASTNFLLPVAFPAVYISEGKGGKTIGGPDKKLQEQTVDYLVTANQKFPNRLDIWMGLAYLYGSEMGDFDSELKVLQRMAVYAKSHGDELRWLKGARLPAPAEQFVPGQLHVNARAYYDMGTKKGYESCEKIARVAIENYPQNALAHKDLEDCRSALKKLHK